MNMEIVITKFKRKTEAETLFVSKPVKQGFLKVMACSVGSKLVIKLESPLCD